MWTEERTRTQLKDEVEETVLKNSIHIRMFAHSDLNAALEIDREVFGGYDPAIFAAFYEYHPSSTLVVEVAGSVVGFVLGFKHNPLEGRVFWLAIKPAYQGRGIGTLLLLEILKIFKNMGAISATLEVRVSNKRAQSLYSTLGFYMTGVCPGYYSDGEAAIVMKRRL